MKDWWTNLWLNEGFTNWIGYYCVSIIFPEYKIWSKFAFKELAETFMRDAFLSSHPVEVCKIVFLKNYN